MQPSYSRFERRAIYERRFGKENGFADKGFEAFQPLEASQSSAALDRAFVAMLPGYRSTGGIATGREIAQRLTRCDRKSLSSVARRVESGELVSIEWRGNLWLPMFQFDSDMRLAAGPPDIVAELAGVFLDPWELAQWFVTPHAALRGRMPVQVVRSDLDSVLSAARLDHFIALG